MRTTLTLNDELYEAVRRLAFEERRTLGEVVNELIAKGLAADPVGRRRVLGQFKGLIEISDDFDEPLESVEAALDESIFP